MQATATPLENHHVKLSVEVDEGEMASALDDAARKLSRQVSIKGFRKGKVPKNVLIAHLGGVQGLRSEAIRESLPDFYARAVSETLIDPIAQPDITITAGEEEGPLAFEADVEVRPEIEITGHRDLRVTIPSPVVTDEEVDAQVDRLRETDAVLKDVDRPIVTGDLVTMDVAIAPVGDEGAEPLVMRDYMYTVGSASLTDGVDDLILGLRAGEDLTVNGPLGPSQVATYSMSLKQVHERELPETTDEWVAENTEWSTANEMRDAIVDQMRRRRVVEAQLSQRDATLIALSDLVPEDVVPDALVEDETGSRLHDLSHRLEQQSLTLESFLQMTGQDPEQLLEALRADARRAVRVDLGLRAVARAEGLEPTDEEVETELASTAEAMGASAEALAENLRETGRVVAFRAEVAKMKASRWLTEHVTFVDPNGVEVDRALLASDQTADGDA